MFVGSNLSQFGSFEISTKIAQFLPDQKVPLGDRDLNNLQSPLLEYWWKLNIWGVKTMLPPNLVLYQYDIVFNDLKPEERTSLRQNKQRWFTKGTLSFWNLLTLSRPSHRERWATPGDSQWWIQLPNMDLLYFSDTWYTRFWNLLSLSRPCHREQWATSGHIQRWILLPNMDPLYFCDTWYARFWNLPKFVKTQPQRVVGHIGRQPALDPTAQYGPTVLLWLVIHLF